MNPNSLFDGWGPILRLLLIAPCAYAALVLMLRLSGKRTLSKLNAFDLIVTVALGSTLASILTSRDLPLVEGLAALLLLILLQYLVSWTAVRWSRFDRLIKSEPTVLLRAGQPIPEAMRRQRVVEDEVRVAIRSAGGLDLEDAEVVFLEADGSLTAILKS